MTMRLTIIVFPGGANLPLWTGIKQGFFAQQGLEVVPGYTRSSVEQISGLVSGQWDIGLTGFDNIVAYQEGQGEAKLDRVPDLFAFMGGDDAFLRLVVQKGIESYAHLRGKTLSVDAVTTGFAFVLRKMLQRNGILESEVLFESAGGVLQRFEALKAGKHAGTLVLTPFELMAECVGLHVLQAASDVLPHYQGIVGVARVRWAEANADTLVSFIRGYLAALRWLFALANRSAAQALLIENVPAMTSELAAAACEIFLSPNRGFDPAARLDPKGMQEVLALRSEYGRPQKELRNEKKYQNASYYRLALAAPS
jgi:ABC-type nitrate/sulfonate/bicarbonate transport system substrate-binding protein